ncbi:MAG: release factor glutamine methyltransferase [Actinomycetota bacterium]|jgi:release factor glutamine methyltransferase|nr:release factor glutamine methyltransferase [Actinomycetota bacterium]
MSAPQLSRDEVVLRLRGAGCVFAEEEADLLLASSSSSESLSAMVERRASGVPLEHVLGWVEFCGLRIALEPGVFVPRPRTEFLVERAVAIAPPGAVVLDLCCGSGAVGAALASAVPDLRVYAADLDPVAVRCARRNLDGIGGLVFEGDLFEPLPDSLRGQVEVLVANVPYVPSDGIAFLPSEARDHEPRLALDGGPDGLDVLRRVAAESRRWLVPGGRLLIETSAAQAPAAVAAFAADGLAAELARSDELDVDVVTGTAAVGG